MQIQPVATQVANVWSQTKNTANGDAANVFTSGSFEGNQHKNFRDANHNRLIRNNIYR